MMDMRFGSTVVRPEWSARLVSTGSGFSWYFDPLEWITLAVILAIFAAFGIAMYRESQRPTFELKKADWACGAAHTETITTYQDMGGGKVVMLVPITTTSTVCDQWVRR